MGATNVALAFARWRHLPDKPFRALVHMCLVTLDNDADPQYWGGWEALADAIGRTPPEEPAPSDKTTRADEFRRMRRNDFEAVKQALRQLFKAGVVTVEKHSAPGSPAVYNLNLHAPTGRTTGKDESVEQGRIILSTGKDESVEQGRMSLPQGEYLPTGGTHPRRTTAGGRGTREEQNSPKVSTSPAAGPSYPQQAGQILDFDAARILLESFPDFGESWLNRPEVKRFTGTENRYIAAAEIALKEMRRRPGTRGIRGMGAGAS